VLSNEAIVDRSHDRPPQRSRRVVEHCIINNGGGGWRVRCDEDWGEGNGTDDWPAKHGAYCTRHCHRHQHHGGMSNTATDRVANSCHRNNANE